jgi:flagellar biogenesis protein FliO
MTTLSVERMNANTRTATIFWAQLWSLLKIALHKVRVQKKQRELHIQETLALGDRRFLAVVHWENEKLLVGVTQQSITLLEPRAACRKAAHALTAQEEQSA